MCIICVELTKGSMTSREARRLWGDQPRIVEYTGDPSHIIRHMQELYNKIKEAEEKETAKAKEPGYIRRTFK